MSAEGWGITFILVLAALIALLIAIVLWQVFKTKQMNSTSRTAIAQDEAYRKLAEQATEAQERTAEELSKATAELTDLRTRVSELERILKEVE